MTIVTSNPAAKRSYVELAVLRSYVRASIVLVVALIIYEIVARSGTFPKALMPTIPVVLATFWDMLVDGTMLRHTLYTLYRVLFGFALAMVVGIPLGIMMARFRPVENFLLPLVSALMPIPSISHPISISTRSSATSDSISSIAKTISTFRRATGIFVSARKTSCGAK